MKTVNTGLRLMLTSASGSLEIRSSSGLHSMSPGSPHCQVYEMNSRFSESNKQFPGYGTGTFAPGVSGIGTTSYISAHNQILGHARAYRRYYEMYAESQGGKIGITLNIHWAEPQDPTNPEHLGNLLVSCLFRPVDKLFLPMHLRELSSLLLAGLLNLFWLMGNIPLS